MTSTSSSLHSKKPSTARSAAPRRHEARAPRPSPSLGHARETVRDGVTQALVHLDAIEDEVAALVRRTVSDALEQSLDAADALSAVMREVLAGAVEAAGDSASALRLGIQGTVRGAVVGVHDAGADLSKAVSEIVKAAIVEGHRLGAELGGVARFALGGVSRGLSEVGRSAVASTTQAADDALDAARAISGLAAEAVRQVVRGAAQGMEEIVNADGLQAQGASPHAGRDAAHRHAAA